MATDGPRVIPGTRAFSMIWKWWPGTESNHRHADFQYDGGPGSARASRRLGSGFCFGDRTALPDRAYPELETRERAPIFAAPQRAERLAGIATELLPNRAPNGPPRSAELLTHVRKAAAEI